MTRILVVDDEPQLLMILEYMLTERGYEVVTALNGAEALRIFDQDIFDLVLLDVTMPRIGGVEVCRRLRRDSDIPVVMLTARSRTEHVVAGFEAGADDYVTKPFEPAILLARLDALLRRVNPAPPALITVGPLTIDTAAGTARVDDRLVALSDVEWRLLSVLAERVGEPLSWRLLLTRVWEVDTHRGGRELVKATIYRLRQRLGDRAAGMVETVRGEGYRLAAW